MKTKVFLLASLVFFIISAVQFSDRYYPTTTAISSSEIVTESNHIYLTSIGISLPILESDVKEGKPWPVSKNSVVKIKEKNIYYGHNWPRILGKLTSTQVGDEIVINLNGIMTSYIVIDVQEVHPSNSDILKAQNDDNLIIYTCSGFLDQYRFVVIASPKV